MPPKLYNELASWWPLLSPPSDYAGEAAIYGEALRSAGDPPARTLLELGSGGGSNASYLKQRFEVTLVDASAAMLAVSRKLNPECEHIQGDMRTLRLQRLFDRVFIHDAIAYMTSLDDLRSAVRTAFAHCRPGGAALFAPDYIRENFRPGVEHGGADGDQRALRYLEWTWDPDPADSTYVVDYAYLLRESDGSTRAEHDRHIEGLFGRSEWLGILESAGFAARTFPVRHSDAQSGSQELFVGLKP
ncbi:MAG: class I SAM-dependent methyltransferase [Bryobacteraceae bacterium]|nr:class I SAM-dependent methyltransferase [Bryobacteraceae bacterium]